MSDTAAILQRHMDGLAAGDLAAIMSDYDGDAVLISGPNTIRGRDAIEQMFKAVAANPPKLTEDVRVVEGDVAYVTWHTADIPFGTDTFVMRDGKIVCQTVGVNR
jgi:uncharacterized protein (TIGR02246 family)